MPLRLRRQLMTSANVVRGSSRASVADSPAPLAVMAVVAGNSVEPVAVEDRGLHHVAKAEEVEVANPVTAVRVVRPAEQLLSVSRKSMLN